MSKSPKELQQERAESSFKRKQMLARDASQAMVDYAAEQAATREKTARLKKERLAKEVADAKAAAEAPEKPKPKGGKSKA